MRGGHILLHTVLSLAWGAACITAADQQQHVLLPPLIPDQSAPPASTPKVAIKQFSLRSIYHVGSHRYPGLMRKADIHKDSLRIETEDGLASVAADTLYDVAAQPVTIQRMADRSRRTVDSILEYGRMGGQPAYLSSDSWTMDEIDGPNVTDRKSVLSLAYMAANAYILAPGTGDWQDIKGAFNYTEDFGWEQDGLRGHIFADTTNSTIVIGLKGTSMAIFDGAETTGHDKENDNLFGSCCCAQGGQFLWKKVCNCMSSQYVCNDTCLHKALREKSHYYHAAKDLYHNVTERYPGAEIWLTGHSLGGVVSALLGLTYGLPVVTYEAFPDALAAKRLGLPTPPGYRIGRHQDRNDTQITHFGHTADPVFMGDCHGATDGCTLAGYAFESKCHTGSVGTYDTVSDLGWRSGVNTHRITVVIRDVLKKYDDVPPVKVEEDCYDCYLWKFFESNGTETTTTTTTSSTKTRKSSTRTATCQTPGWWGCLDETTSTPTTTTSTMTTTLCVTPGWFGCKDLITTTITTTVTTSEAVHRPKRTSATVTATSTTIATTTKKSKVTSPTKTHTKSSTTCTSPGWFGCLDPSPTTAMVTSTSEMATTSAATSTATCLSRGWLGRCHA